ncbi:MAG: phosphotransferase [Clostridiales bacterium]|nr:phosphotransferase [Clostridiales bacterium]
MITANIFEKAKELYELDGYDFDFVSAHEGGRNRIVVCVKEEEKKYVLRISDLSDRTKEDYLAETEFIRYLADNGAPVADVIPSKNGKLVECIEEKEGPTYISLFEYAKGMLMVDNGYRYREGAPLEEYFYNMGKALGAIHRLSKAYKPEHKRIAFFDKYTMDYIGKLIPDQYSDLKEAIRRRLESYTELPVDNDGFGLVHFDYCDGNYHVDMKTGDITVFDFDNCIYCWYMFDLAHIWTHGVGWCQFEKDPKKRMAFMDHYFETVLEGYRSETDVAQELLDQLQLFIDMTIIELLVDEFECAAREGELPDEEDIGISINILVHDVPFCGVGEVWE